MLCSKANELVFKYWSCALFHPRHGDTSPCSMPPDKTVAKPTLGRDSSPTYEGLKQMYIMHVSLPSHLSPPLPHSRACPHTLHKGLEEGGRFWPGPTAEKLPSAVSWMNSASLTVLDTRVMLRLEHPLAKSKLKGSRNEQALLLTTTTLASPAASVPAQIPTQHHLQQQI